MSIRGPLPWADAVAVAVRIAGALETAHRAGIIHRDIKPSNLLTDDTGQPRLADFGIARLADTESLTATGAVTGSLRHVAPEVLEGRRGTQPLEAGPQDRVDDRQSVLRQQVGDHRLTLLVAASSEQVGEEGVAVGR